MKEKEIIDKLKELQNDSFEWQGGEDLIDFIKNLKKENEELKKNQRYKKDFNVDKIFCLEYDKETLRDMVLEQQEKIKDLQKEILDKDVKIRNLKIENESIMKTHKETVEQLLKN